MASATAVALVLVGVGLQWRAMLVVGTALTLVCVSSVAYLLRPPDLRIHRRVTPDRVPKGELAIAHLQIGNRGHRTFAGAVGVQQVGDVEVEVELPRLRRAEKDVRTSVLPTDRRGLYEVGPIVLRRSDPFGLVVAEQRHARPEQLLVLPRILPFRALRHTLTRSIDGAVDDTSPHGSMTFHQLREYVPGDDIRKIHWPSTAKLSYSGDLIVRQDVDDAQPYVVVLVDLRPDNHTPETFELALDAAASAVVAAATGRAPFQLRTTGGLAVGGPTNQTTVPALEALALAEPTPDHTLSAELTAMRRTKGGAVLVVVTGVPQAGEMSAVAGLRGRFQRVLLVSVTPEPEPARAHPGVRVVQGASEDQLVKGWNVAMR